MAAFRPNIRDGAFSVRATTSRRARYGSRSPIRYRLPRFCARTTTLLMDYTTSAMTPSIFWKYNAPLQTRTRTAAEEATKRILGRVAPACQRPAETLNRSGHGVQSVQPSPAHWNETARVGNRRSEHPKLYEERHNISNVAIHGVQGGKPKADTQRRQDYEQEKERKQEDRHGRWNTVIGHHEQQHDKADSKVKQW